MTPTEEARAVVEAWATQWYGEEAARRCLADLIARLTPVFERAQQVDAARDHLERNARIAGEQYDRAAFVLTGAHSVVTATVDEIRALRDRAERAESYAKTVQGWWCKEHANQPLPTQRTCPDCDAADFKKTDAKCLKLEEALAHCEKQRDDWKDDSVFHSQRAVKAEEALQEAQGALSNERRLHAVYQRVLAERDEARRGAQAGIKIVTGLQDDLARLRVWEGQLREALTWVCKEDEIRKKECVTNGIPWVQYVHISKLLSDAPDVLGAVRAADIAK